MNSEFHRSNRTELYNSIPPGSMAILYSGQAPRKTGDEYYPFFANRSFVYLTGIEQQNSILVALKTDDSSANEVLFMLPPNLLEERWNGKRLSEAQTQEQSGIEQVRYFQEFQAYTDRILKENKVEYVYLDFDKLKSDEPDNESFRMAAYIRDTYPGIIMRNLQKQLKKQRTIKKPCEIEALRKAEEITRDGIIAMMQASKPGMYEYQYKAIFDSVLTNQGVLAPGFPSIISAGQNNFCIHYYSYRGQAKDGDLILNDVGATYDNMINDVSRGWPCNGKYTEQQRLLYECAYETSNYMFSILKPGIPMLEVDRTAKKYNYELLKKLGLCKEFKDADKYIWHGGAHHIGYDVHDMVTPPDEIVTAPGMVFCVDIGIYCEPWGTGFRLEDNCLITESGCENLSAAIPRKMDEIEAIMGK